MTGPGTPRRTLRERLRGRPWLPLVAVAVLAVAVLAVVAGGSWLLPRSTAAPVPAAATTSAPPAATTTAPTTTSPVPTTAAPTATTTATATTTTETPPITTAPEPDPAPAATTTEVTAPAPADPGAEGQVLALVNTARTAAGCGEVVADDGLAGVARAHSVDMRDRGFFSHTTPEGLGPWDRAAAAGVSGASAENIAQGYGDAASVMTGWMDSPGHRANILDCSNTRLGVGVAEGPGGPWWTQLFGR